MLHAPSVWLAGLFLALGAGPTAADPPAHSLDLAAVSVETGGLRRVHGSTGDGSSGVPVAGGHDCDGDGFRDYAFAAMRASPLGRTGAGEVALVFGDGTVQGAIDSAGL